MALDKLANMQKISESLMLTIRKNMEENPGSYAGQKPPTSAEIMLFMGQQQQINDKNPDSYQMKISEAIELRLKSGHKLLSE